MVLSSSSIDPRTQPCKSSPCKAGLAVHHKRAHAGFGGSPGTAPRAWRTGPHAAGRPAHLMAAPQWQTLATPGCCPRPQALLALPHLQELPPVWLDHPGPAVAALQPCSPSCLADGREGLQRERCQRWKALHGGKGVGHGVQEQVRQQRQVEAAP